MARARHVRQISAPADKVFGIVAGWANLTTTMRGTVKKSVLDDAGYIRSLTLPDGSILRERLLRYDAARRIQEYEIIDERDNGVPMKNYVARIKVTPEGTRRCVVNWSSTFEPKRGKTADECREMILGVYTLGCDSTERLVKNR